jgi:predicted nucleic acid-binding protein
MTADPGDSIWVADASALILLGKLDELRLLTAMAPRVVVPAAVVEELAAGAALQPEGGRTLAWAQARLVSDIAVAQSIAGRDLGAGESQVLAHCLVGGNRAVLDDAEARAAARVLRGRTDGQFNSTALAVK